MVTYFENATYNPHNSLVVRQRARQTTLLSLHVEPEAGPGTRDLCSAMDEVWLRVIMTMNLSIPSDLPHNTFV